MNLLLRILHLKLEPPDNTSNSTAQFGSSKIFSDTGPLAMQESDLRIVCRGTTIVVDDLLAVPVVIDPALWQELLPIVAPEFRAAVDGVRTDEDASAFGDMLACYGGIADGFANRDGYSGI